MMSDSQHSKGGSNQFQFAINSETTEQCVASQIDWVNESRGKADETSQNQSDYDDSSFSRQQKNLCMNSQRVMVTMPDRQRQAKLIDKLQKLKRQQRAARQNQKKVGSQMRETQNNLKRLLLEKEEAVEKVPETKMDKWLLQKKIVLIKRQDQRLARKQPMSYSDEKQIDSHLTAIYKKIVKKKFQENVHQFYSNYAQQLKFEALKLYQAQSKSKLKSKANVSPALTSAQKIQVIENRIQKQRKEAIIIERIDRIEQEGRQMQNKRKQTLAQLKEQKILLCQLKQKMTNEQDKNIRPYLEIDLQWVTTKIEELKIRYDEQKLRQQENYKLILKYEEQLRLAQSQENLYQSSLEREWVQLKKQKMQNFINKDREQLKKPFIKSYQNRIRCLHECYEKGKNIRQNDFDIMQTKFYHQTAGQVEAQLQRAQKYLINANLFRYQIEEQKRQLSKYKISLKITKIRLEYLKKLKKKLEDQLAQIKRKKAVRNSRGKLYESLHEKIDNQKLEEQYTK